MPTVVTGSADLDLIACSSEQEVKSARESLRPILESHCFDRAETQKKVLIYLWMQRGKDISEYAIAVDALGRRPDFDPKIDATVRVQVSRLRKKLKEFYESEGQSCPLKLNIPVGSHMLEVVEAAPLMPPPPSVAALPLSYSRWLLPAALGLCAVLAIMCAWLLWSRAALLPVAAKPAKDSPIAFWSDFIGNASKTQIVLPAPVFFKFPNRKELRVRDIDVNDFRNWQSSPELVELAKSIGNPHIEQSYTVASDTVAAIALARYLDSVGLGSAVVFNIDGNTSMNDLESSNGIVLGAHGTLQPFQAYLDQMNFSLNENEGGLEVRHPSGSEPKLFKATDEGGGRTIEPGIIAVLPGKSATTKLLILQARHTSALVAMLTSTTGADLITKMRRTKGNPKFYEVAVLIEMNGDHMIRAWPADISVYKNSQ